MPSSEDKREPEKRERDIGQDGLTVWLVTNAAIISASIEIVKAINGEDDGTMERDDMECKIQEVLRRAFATWGIGYKQTLKRFQDFVGNLHDADPEDELFENIVCCAWWRLTEFARYMGQDFVKIVEQYWTPSEETEEDGEEEA